MTQFGTDLLNSVQKSFAGYLMRDKDLKRIANRVRDGTDYQDANEYAVRVGELLVKSIDDNTQTLPYMSQEVARELLTPLLSETHDLVAGASAQVQKNMNNAAGIGLEALEPDLDTNRIDGLVNKVASYGTYDEARWVMHEPVINYHQAIVDQAIRKNASAHTKAGFEAVIIRKTEAHKTITGRKIIRGRAYPYKYTVPCKWCAGLEGVYRYKDVSNRGNDVFRRHEACRCIIIYKDGNKTIDVRTQHEWTGEDADRIAARIGRAEQAQQPKPKADNDLSRRMGEAYNQADAIAEAAPEKNRAVWRKYVDRIRVGSLSETDGAYARGSEIFIDLAKEINPQNGYDKPFQTYFHECHHVIDKTAGRDMKSPFHYSAIYKDGLFPKTIRDEVQALVAAKADIIKPLAAAGDLDGLINVGAISARDRWLYENGYNTLKYSKSMAYRAVQSEVMQLSRIERCDLSDILEGATNGKISCGFGHGASYWSDRKYGEVYDGLATEAFAEMSDSTFANPEALSGIQKYLPKSYAVYLEMIESLAG